MFVDVLLGIWTATGIAWWIISWRLVAEAARAEKADVPSALVDDDVSLSIFKPLPRLGAEGMMPWATGLESFVSQLGAQDELLLGIHEADRANARPFLEDIGRRFPAAQVRTVYRSAPDRWPNPKISWQQVLAAEAQGVLWLWSDADIIAPAGFLRRARGDFAASGTSMITFPYRVAEAATPSALLDALFVNVEFYPGVLLLRRLGPVDFGLGAGLLFRAEDFRQKVEWRDLGSRLADDFLLGQKLGPVRIGDGTLVTTASASSWREALLHHLRWSKTVWWNRPIGSAARIVVLPVFGWIIYAATHPSRAEAWIGLAGMVLAEVVFAGLIFRSTGLRCARVGGLVTALWSVWRVLVWLACWLPWPVLWAGRWWWRPSVEDIDKDS